MKVFILGTGATGGLLARLLNDEGYRVTCGDADPNRAASFAGSGIDIVKVNARRCDGIADAAGGCDLLVNCVPAKFNCTVLRAALGIRAHYLDLAAHLGRNPFKPEQLLFGPQFLASNRCAVITAGAAPGLTNLLAAEAAERFDTVDWIRIRLFEDTDSDQPISTWSAEVAHDEAISRPRVYRNGRYQLARRFDELELFAVPPPIGAVPVVLAAQDEVATLPRFLRARNVDAKIGGNEISRLRELYLIGRLRPSRKRGRLFPDTLEPAELDRLVRRGAVHKARFARCVVVTGNNGGLHFELRNCCVFPSLLRLRRRGIDATPVAFAAAESALLFVRHFPAQMNGVHAPEGLPMSVRGAILRDLEAAGCRITTRTRRLSRTETQP